MEAFCCTRRRHARTETSAPPLLICRRKRTGQGPKHHCLFSFCARTWASASADARVALCTALLGPGESAARFNGALHALARNHRTRRGVNCKAVTAITKPADGFENALRVSLQQALLTQEFVLHVEPRLQRAACGLSACRAG